jgi:hypothetical protein
VYRPNNYHGPSTKADFMAHGRMRILNHTQPIFAPPEGQGGLKYLAI